MTTTATPETAPPAAEARPNRLRRSWDKYWYAYAMVAPVVIVLGVLIFYPLVRGIVLSLTNATNRNIGSATIPSRYTYVGIDNYTRIPSGEDGQFYPVLLRTVVWTLSCVVLSRRRDDGARALHRRHRRLRAVPDAVPRAPPAHVALPGHPDVPVRDPHRAHLHDHGAAPADQHVLALILANCTIAVPFCAYLLKGYFDTIPIEIEEAGRVDGLSPLGTFWRLALPLSLPGLAVTAFYTFITAWGEVAYASRFMTSDDKYTLAFGMQTYVGQFKTEWGDLAAASILVTVPALVVFYVVQRYLVSGLTAGGTKG